MSVFLKVPRKPEPPVEMGGLRVRFKPAAVVIDFSGKKHKEEIKIKARRTLAGDILIFEHPEVDIVISPTKKKISVSPKGKVSDDSYDIQDKFFKYMSNRGMVNPATVQSASAYGILEGKYYENDDFSSLGVVMSEIKKFIDVDKENYVYDEVFEKMEKEMIDPDEDRTTELGEIPHEEMQGSLRPGYVYPYGTYGAMGLYRI